MNRRQEEPDFATYYLPFPTFFAAPKNSKIVTNYIVLEQKRRKISDLEHISCRLSPTSFWKILICVKQGHPSCFVHKGGIDLHNLRHQKCIYFLGGFCRLSGAGLVIGCSYIFDTEEVYFKDRQYFCNLPVWNAHDI